jgi:hypothetical protein
MLLILEGLHFMFQYQHDKVTKFVILFFSQDMTKEGKNKAILTRSIQLHASFGLLLYNCEEFWTKMIQWRPLRASKMIMV